MHTTWLYNAHNLPYEVRKGIANCAKAGGVVCIARGNARGRMLTEVLSSSSQL